jgi:trehalose 6-phosphate synthase
MRRFALFVTLLVLALGGLSLVGHAALTRTLRTWFEGDLSMPARLAVASARQSLAISPGADAGRLVDTLDDITRDRRILAAAACAEDGSTLAATSAYPHVWPCEAVLRRVRSAVGDPPPEFWSAEESLPEGPVHLSASWVQVGEFPPMAVVLVHDLAYLERREATTRNMLLVAFFVLAVLASVITLLAMRLAWRRWTAALRTALTGSDAAAPDDFMPLVRDVRALAEQLASEQAREARGGLWSAERLRATLREHLGGERVVILANREPYIHDRAPDGTVRVLHPASGLVTALEPVMRACSGTWVAHGAGTADRETVDAHDRVLVPPGEESYRGRRVWLSDEEEAGYYYGFSNEGLWPMCHVAHTRPVFRASDWAQYVAVNQRFADAVCAEVDRDDPIILVQDYHFALAPRMIRQRLPQATIITFWHIPWPNAELVGICPWREALLDGLLGSSVVGFHTQQHCNHFIDAVDAFMESRIDRELRAVVQGERRTLVRPYPISIEWPVAWLRTTPPVPVCRRAVRAELGLAPDVRLGLGVDRLDYTKGIEERLRAVDLLLERSPEHRGRFVFLQIAAPSRTKIGRYKDLNDEVERLANEINTRWGTPSYQPIILLRRHHDPSAVYRLYRAADLCYVSSLHDGMNLVAKEFVAAREDGEGVLVLSQFTGAARDLTEALIVNPYDLHEAAAAMAKALSMPVDEQRERMGSMRRFVTEFNVYRWAGRMLVDAAEIRRRERLAHRHGPSGPAGPAGPQGPSGRPPPTGPHPVWRSAEWSTS